MSFVLFILFALLSAVWDVCVLWGGREREAEREAERETETLMPG